MWMFIGLLSFVGLLFFSIKGILSFIKKAGKAKKNFIISGACFVLLIAAVSFDGPVTETASTTPKEEKVNNEEKDKEEKKKAEEKALVEKEAAEKAEAEKLKAEKEAKQKAEEEAKKKAKAEEKEKAEEAAKLAAQKPTFNLTWDQFKNNWSNIVPEIKGSSIDTIYEGDIVNQNGNIVVNAKVADFLMMMADVDSNTQKIKYVMVMAETSQSDNSQNMDILMGFGNLIANSNPSLTADERGNILMSGLGFDSGDLQNLDKTYVYKGVEYQASNMGGLLTLSIKPK